MTEKSPNKKLNVLDELLDQGLVQVLVDSRIEGVVVPPHLIGDLQLRLNLSRRFGLPLVLTETGVDATLTFQKIPYECTIPWGAIYAIISYVTGEPFLFPEDVPLEVVLEAENAMDEHNPEPLEPTAHLGKESFPSQPQLRVVKENQSPLGTFTEVAPAESQSPPEPPPKEPTPSRRGHLRVVK